MRPFQTGTFTTHDGVSLFYRHWPAIGATSKGAVALFHRGHEHSGRMGHLADELAMPDYDFFAWDARGHGQSPGERGDAPSFATLVRDVQAFIDHIGTAHHIAPADIAHSKHRQVLRAGCQDLMGEISRGERCPQLVLSQVRVVFMLLRRRKRIQHTRCQCLAQQREKERCSPDHHERVP